MRSEIERKKTEKELSCAGEIISRSPAVAFVWENAEGWPVTYVSDNVDSIFGWGKNDFLSARISYVQVIYPDDLPRVAEEVSRFSADETADRVVHQPYRIVDRDGIVKWVEDLTTILRDEDGVVTGYEGILIDITARKQLEEKLELVQFSIDRAAEGISWVNADGRIVYANETECRSLGYTLEELFNLTVFDIDPSLTPETWPVAWEMGKESGGRTFETLHRRKDETVFPVEVSVNYIEHNGVGYSFAFGRDITERKQAQAEQERLKMLLVNSVEIASLGPWEHDILNDTFIFNDHFYKIYHTTAEQVGGYTMSSDDYIRRFIHPDDVASVRAGMQSVMSEIDSHTGQMLEHRILYADGGTGYVAVRLYFVRDPAGRVVRAYGVNQDITERKLVERERLVNLKYFESMEKVNGAIQAGANDLDRILKNVLDVCLLVFECDRAFLAYPCDPEAPFWSIPFERTKPEYPSVHAPGETIPMAPDVVGDIRIILDTTGPVLFDPQSAYPPREVFWENHRFRSLMVMALQPKVGKPWMFGLHQCSHARTWTSEEAGLFEKIGRRFSDSLTSLLMYRDLRNNEEFLNSIVENIPDTILVKDAKSLRFLSVNKAGEKLLGFSREELVGKNSYDLVPEDQARLYAESDKAVIGGKEMVEFEEETIRDKAGNPKLIHTKKIPVLDERGTPQHLLIISRDITDLRKLQAQLNQAQKMEALGAMSGGIAHDFNNILQPMLGYCEFLKEDLPPDSPQQKFVEGIFTSGLRAKDLVNQILAFSRQTDRKMISVRIQSILKEVVKLSRSTIPSNIEIKRDIQQDCAPVMADPTQLHQIMLNLIINAHHAMEENGGEIFIGLKETVLGEDTLKSLPLEPGRYVVLSVSDTGCGIEPAVLDKIFEPYFTTKAQGKGTGLGLAVVYGIVKEHGGHINVSSEVGKGTVFNVYLPSAGSVVEEAPSAQPAKPHVGGSESILLVDDEGTIVMLERRMLERLGYRVTSCSNGVEALSAFKADPHGFDLVITDMSMPNMTGDQLSKELITIRPDIPIIICTGFSEKISRDAAMAIGVKALLMKPVTVSEMTQKVRKVLDGREDDV